MDFNYIINCIIAFSALYLSVSSLENVEDGIDSDFGDMTQSTTVSIQDTPFQVPDEKWISNALRNIAHYLRNYKFNDWDHRYYTTRPDEDLIGYYDKFPVPVLRSLHWKVYQNCDRNFYKCITYLMTVIRNVPFSRSNDIVTFLNENVMNNETLINNINAECVESKLNSEKSSFPFDNPIEKFQWRTTASYYMCWYTMLGTPALSMLGDICDNYANCLDPEFEQRNRDPRSDDRLSFACAKYSFCPDPCCPLKHVELIDECHKNIFNPCFEGNRENEAAKKICIMDKKENINFKAIISNKWNVSCHCDKAGFIFKSEFGICVDVNECLSERSPCDNLTEDCLNISGSYKCICKWGFQLDSTKQKCINDSDLKFSDYINVNSNNFTTNTNTVARFFNYFGIKI